MKPFIFLVILTVVGAVIAIVVINRRSSSSDSSGAAERAGAAVDRAEDKGVEAGRSLAEKTSDAAHASATATKDVADQVVKKTGEAMGKAGEALDSTGTDMQK